jgi:hypothetical protein
VGSIAQVYRDSNEQDTLLLGREQYLRAVFMSITEERYRD